MCDMTHSYVRHDSFIRVTWLMHTCDMTHSYVWHDSFICVTWLIHTCDMTHSYVWHDSFICVTWLIHTCDMSQSFTCVTWLIHMCGMTHSRPHRATRKGNICSKRRSTTMMTGMTAIHRSSLLGQVTPNIYVFHELYHRICASRTLWSRTEVYQHICVSLASSLSGAGTPNIYVFHELMNTCYTNSIDTYVLHELHHHSGQGPQTHICCTNSTIAHVLLELYYHELYSVRTYVLHKLHYHPGQVLPTHMCFTNSFITNSTLSGHMCLTDSIIIRGMYSQHMCFTNFIFAYVLHELYYQELNSISTCVLHKIHYHPEQVLLTHMCWMTHLCLTNCIIAYILHKLYQYKCAPRTLSSKSDALDHLNVTNPILTRNTRHTHVFYELYHRIPHEKLLGIQWVSNPSTENQRISTPAHSNGYKSEMHVSSELMVQIKQKGVYGVETLLPRSFLGGILYTLYQYICASRTLSSGARYSQQHICVSRILSL